MGRTEGGSPPREAHRASFGTSGVRLANPGQVDAQTGRQMTLRIIFPVDKFARPNARARVRVRWDASVRLGRVNPERRR